MRTILDYEIVHKVAKSFEQSPTALFLIWTACVTEIKAQLQQGNSIQIVELGELAPNTASESVDFLCDPDFAETLRPAEEE